jgi:hypothetical protein
MAEVKKGKTPKEFAGQFTVLESVHLVTPFFVILIVEVLLPRDADLALLQ